MPGSVGSEWLFAVGRIDPSLVSFAHSADTMGSMVSLSTPLSYVRLSLVSRESNQIRTRGRTRGEGYKNKGQGTPARGGHTACRCPGSKLRANQSVFLRRDQYFTNRRRNAKRQGYSRGALRACAFVAHVLPSMQHSVVLAMEALSGVAHKKQENIQEGTPAEPSGADE